MSDLDLNAIKARAESATPGPWTIALEVDGFRAGRETVVRADGKRVVTVDQTRPHWDEDAEANVAFIANAREDVPALIAEIERLCELVKVHNAREYTEEREQIRAYIADLEAENADLRAQLGGRPDLETGEALPAGVEGHQLGHRAEVSGEVQS